MNALYGYNTGSFESIPFANEAIRLNARLDYNISNNHRAMVRFNRYDSFNDVMVYGNSVRGAVPRYSSTNRFGPESLTFRYTHYSNDNVITSLVVEFNSTFRNYLSNTFRLRAILVTDPQRSDSVGQEFLI